MFVLLMVLTILAVLALVVVLVYYLAHIIGLLEAIGGKPASLLAKLRLGLRAIETETGALPAQVPPLNETLGAIAGGLQQVDRHLVGTIEAVLRQERRSTPPASPLAP